MKRLVALCDGTWSTFNGRKSNVGLLNDGAIKPIVDPPFKNRNQGPVRQLVKHFEGVGTYRGLNVLYGTWSNLTAAAFGWGLDDKIKEVYRWIAEKYEPGDEIYVFGFSRGAYTARSLVGFMRAVGLMDDKGRNQEQLVDAFRHYRSRHVTTHPASIASIKYRWEISKRVFTDAEEQVWRERQAGEFGDVGYPLTVRYLGIWDTVGALGVPGTINKILRLQNQKYNFHDAKLTRMVEAGRHAMAADERRPNYPPTIWENIQALNDLDMQEFRRMYPVAQLSDEQIRARRKYLQQWFPGDHGMVGGTGEQRELSDCTLGWVIAGAIEQGLVFEPSFLDRVARGSGYGGPVSDRPHVRHGSPRPIAPDSRDVSDTALHRLAFGNRYGQPYHSETLLPVYGEIARKLPDTEAEDQQFQAQKPQP